MSGELRALGIRTWLAYERVTEPDGSRIWHRAGRFVVVASSLAILEDYDGLLARALPGPKLDEHGWRVIAELERGDSLRIVDEERDDLARSKGG